jgi:hypothetical protein
MRDCIIMNDVNHRLNVGGYIFEVEWETLTRIPDSR